MKTATSTFLLVLFTWHSCFANILGTHKLPFKVKVYEVEFRFHSGDRYKGYLIDATPEYIYIVKDKDMIEEAILTDCKNCKRFKTIQVSSVKGKKSLAGAIIGILAVIVTLGIITTSRDGTTGDDPSEQVIAAITLIPIGLTISLVILITNSQSKRIDNVVKMKKNSSLFDYGKKKAESLRKFYKNPHRNKYTFYIDNFSKEVQAYYVSMDTDNLYLAPSIDSKKGPTFSIAKERIQYIK